MTTTEEKDRIRSTVRAHYGEVARTEGPVACAPGCCATLSPKSALQLGYSEEDLGAVPDGANMGIGCGNPTAIASLQPGETVLDLGSGGGFDCFLAARQVGARGKVIGVDMTADMVSKARANAAKLAATNVEFRLGEIEHLPVADEAIDVILSNCVINLSPDKAQVFEEAMRVLKPGGRLAISDVLSIAELPPALRQRAGAISACVAGAAPSGEVERMLMAAGFEQIRVSVRPESRGFIKDWLPGVGAENFVASATIEAVKPHRRIGAAE